MVDSDGATALSTNKVAQRAGVSIGTLYQYFPTKEAIVVGTRAVIGVIRSASLENSALLDTQELEDELVRMVWRLLVSSD
ncbi:TetR/AcrR family transcriptional regulator [Aquabacterium sp.]|uniref:TetR/AcrR family transcriptional regulator n=1 Tax=Aquabacterium sp. TaxID=1872578 RepID=UPI0019C80774|nr:TetR/AcrR family transcriptional regulator [Aquabacterium sp.]MBC7700967.1 helix-turn-helix transcriptional regulator [Aquabacterium sp.]